MLPSQVQSYFKVQRVATSVSMLSFGIVVSVIANWVSQQWVSWLPVIIALAILSGLVSLFVFFREKRGFDVTVRPPHTIRSPDEAQAYAQRGFVCFVPLYTPKRNTEADGLPLEERMEAVEALDFDKLQVEESNLYPTIQAIVSHASRLEHCWLLSTRSREVAGSEPYARLLAEYLRQRKGLTCEFHYEGYTISLDDDALVSTKTYDQVRRVYDEAQGEGKRIPAREMIADITTGVRSMTLGMILACLHVDQDIQFVGTHYDDWGRPDGDVFPIIYSFEPILK